MASWLEWFIMGLAGCSGFDHARFTKGLGASGANPKGQVQA
jgi:hypothetical protein